MNNYQTEQYRGFTIEINYDECPPNPRQEWDNLGTMVCWNNRYDLGDESTCNPIDWLCKMLGIDEELPIAKETWDNLYKRFSRDYISRPLFLYDHGGITISTKKFSCQWDSGQIGYIYVDKKKVREQFCCKRISKKIKQRVLDILESEVKVYDNYSTGEVFGFDCQLDSCWGYFGDDEIPYMISEAKSIIDHHIKETTEKEIQQHEKMLKKWIKSKVPFQYRTPLCLTY